VRAKQSFTALGTQSCFGVLTPKPISHAIHSRFHWQGVTDRNTTHPGELPLEAGRSQPSPAAGGGEGLLHDARNLMGTIGLYCDLLSMPGVLKPEHRQYPEELRLLGARSKALIEHLMESLFALEGEAGEAGCSMCVERPDSVDPAAYSRLQSGGTGGGLRGSGKPASLRSVVERCSGLLMRVANGRTMEITYGPAAVMPVRAPEEAVERILVNLVRNAVAALSGGERGEGRKKAISIVVGPVVSRVGEHSPWPFQRVRLVVEDAGCGMSPQQVEHLLDGHGARSRGGHGIGFCVVRELVAASDGEIRVMSQPEMGTVVQIEWPMAAKSAEEAETTDRLPGEILKQMEATRS
jgi:signal transduction histidine kinase